MIDWQSEALKLWSKKKESPDGKPSWNDITNELMPLFPGLTFSQVKEKIRIFIRRQPEYKSKNPVPVKTKPQKIFQNLEPEVLKVNWRGNRVVRFGLMGDTQINSKYTQLTHLHSFYDECVSQGIKHVYHTGDIDEGEQMRTGHQYECYNQGADDHVAEIVRVYPRRENVTTHFITGNHDASMIKHCGHNIGPAIAEKRKDMEYLGQDCAIVELTPNCKLELRHPWDGSAYAWSYKPQKMIEAMSGGEKPNILAIGHYHKAEYLEYRSVHCCQTGCFQAQTPFMRGKSIAAIMGGWIFEIEVDEQGYIQTLKNQFIPFYTAIKDDYLNWRNFKRG